VNVGKGGIVTDVLSAAAIAAAVYTGGTSLGYFGAADAAGTVGAAEGAGAIDTGLSAAGDEALATGGDVAATGGVEIGSAVTAGSAATGTGILGSAASALGASSGTVTAANTIGNAVSGIGAAASGAAAIKNLVDPVQAPQPVTPPPAPTINQAEAVTQEEEQGNQSKGALANLLAPSGGFNFFPSNASLKNLLGA